MTKQLYIGNLPFQTTEEQVRRLCAPFGTVKSVAMISDRQTGRFRGFCFVEMEKGAANAAIEKLDGSDVNGRSIRVSAAKPRKKQKGRGPKKQSNRKTKESRGDDRPLHEKTSRGLSDGNSRFPHSGGSRGRSSRGSRGQGKEDSDFPYSGGSVRRNR